VILDRSDEKRWLNSDLPLAEVTAMLKPYSGADMNAYPVDKAIKHPRANGVELVQPAGPPVFSEKELKVEQDVFLQGMGWSRSRERRDGEKE
jgi:hypothetical protein